ncbi:pyridoxal-dependent decarboxylase, exosortase A system-associated [Kangiella koreensis]|uniref:Pyridoxal-dependent decarboxylase, exosortase system type 1 associated n=1 Tax=Kangiella koreensis (strain DSM 16069 / JCM 12317 / KCTC 12182 / SW-125) TaxID=523791 RepID=C7R6Q1_KANKD|nr:pyridoxal-dependent decarboxylase, exosortase A system-associated [Kangiella koreensis]ACV25567.1 pyridoxal-dependent decarboxylase, exosortase system type 1 associated [Kangiella koreensis DSM 16069]
MSHKTHADMNQFESRDGQLVIAGYSVEEVVAIAGQTPCYVYDRSVIKQNVDRLRRFFPKVSLHYAIKANPMPAVVNYLSHQVDGLDVASAKELHTALSTGISPSKVSFAGPGKSEQELTMAIFSGITINIESITELKRIITIADSHDRVANIALRLNPDFELKSSGMKMGGGPQQFGIDVEQLDQVFELLEHPKLNFMGLHIFTGSQNLNAGSIITAHNSIFALVARLHAEYGFSLKHLNIGGGFGIPYFPGDKLLDLEPIAENLNKLIDEHQSLLNDCELILELGRYLVGNAGIYLCQITDKKVSRGQTYLIANGGLHHHLAASGNFGQVIRKNYPVAIANRMQQSDTELVNIVGPLCTPLDILANKMELPKAQIGDWVAVYQSGAYGFTASPRDFLSHPHPVELLL